MVRIHMSGAPGADDPHLWMDPLTMKQWIGPLLLTLNDVGIDAASSGARVEADLDSLNSDVESIVGRIPAERRKLVTGHESMGYFAERYKFHLVRALIPSITAQAEASAGELAALTDKIRNAGDRERHRDQGCRAFHPQPAHRRYISFVHDRHRLDHRGRADLMERVR